MSLKELTERTEFSLKKHSPEIFVIAGVVGVVASAILACRATLKVNSILEEAKDNKERIKDALEQSPEKYSEEDAKKDMVIVYAKTTANLTKIYAPAVLLGAASIAAIIKSNRILRKENIALAAAYTSVTQAFKQYRKRVSDKIGEEAEKQLRFNVVEKEIEETIVDESGKEKKVKKKIEVVDPKASDCIKYLTPTNENWQDNDQFIIDWLNIKQSYFNQKLKEKKHLVLNEVYEELGFTETAAGMVSGWTYNLAKPNGDNNVELTVRKVRIPDEYGYYQKAFAIDFNIDGNIQGKF